MNWKDIPLTYLFFSIQVHLPCFNDKQWIVITANLSTRRFFDIMNPDGSGNDKFTTIISSVTFNFKCLFVKTYPNCTSFNIKDFDYRFVPVPRTHFRCKNSHSLFTIAKTLSQLQTCAFIQINIKCFLLKKSQVWYRHIPLANIEDIPRNGSARIFNCKSLFDKMKAIESLKFVLSNKQQMLKH